MHPSAPGCFFTQKHPPLANPSHRPSPRTLIPLPLLACCALLATLIAPASANAADLKPKTGQPWRDMDYGPFLSASIEAPEPRTNIAYKGIAIRLPATTPNQPAAAVLFDTDLLRYAAGWTGDFVALKGVVFDGEHWAYPAIQGRQIFGNPTLPGYAHDGDFSDPRPFPYGPLPRQRARWKGLYLHGQDVVLALEVDGTTILEHPALERPDSLTVFTRHLQLDPSPHPLQINVAFDPSRPLRFFQRASLSESPPLPTAATTLAVFCPPEPPHFQGTLDELRLDRRALSSQEIAALTDVQPRIECLAASVHGAPPGSHWESTPEGQLRLSLPPHETTLHVTLRLTALPHAQLSALARYLDTAPPTRDLAPLTQSGPPRWNEPINTQTQSGPDQGPFALDTLTWPDDNPWHSWMRFGGLDFFSDPTRAALCTWSGDVWTVHGLDHPSPNLTWRRIATGLFQPLGLKIVNDQVYVLGRDQITRLHDLNGDGETDFYECFNHDTMTTEHFHEFALDLQTDDAGNFYYMKAARHARPALHPHHGTFLKVSPDGARTEILAYGHRAPNGLLLTPGGDAYTTDQEGYWLPANRINLLRPGSFHGNNWAWLPNGRQTTYDLPVTWIHPSIDRSPSTLAWVNSPSWSPLQDRLLSLSYGVGRVFLVSTQWVGATLQGGITPLPFEFETGLMRARFNPRDGHLYVCGLYGWAGNKTQPGGFYRIRRTHHALQLPSDVLAVADGLVLRFLQPLDPSSASNPGNYNVQSWNYRWTENYGSPDFKANGDKGRDRLAIQAAHLTPDGRTVFLQIPTLAPAMQMHVQMNLQNADGSPLQTYVHHTVHTLDPRPGNTWVAPQTSALPHGTSPSLLREQPGLRQSLTAPTTPNPDVRRSRLAALFVPSNSSPSPYLPPGRFASRWTGFLRTDLSETVRFHLEGRGNARLLIDGRPVLDRPNLADPAPVSAPVHLRGGLNPIQLDFESPPAGEAVLRLYWEGQHFVREPIPPNHFVHEAQDPDLALGNQRRLGHQLFLEHQCAQCHLAPAAQTASPDSGWPSGAASLDAAGHRFHPAWLVQWLLAPHQMVPGARMPSLLSGSASEQTNQANNLAAFLSTRQAQPETNPPPTATPELASQGANTFANLGCVACHLPPDGNPLPDDPRRPLHHVRAKWQPAALARFLAQPEAEHPSTWMPNFQLSPAEIQGLAAFLLASGAAPQPPPSGDPDAGRTLAARLGCANCHSLAHVPKLDTAPSLAALPTSNLADGCLAESPAHADTAPRFDFTPAERAALRHFLAHDLSALEHPVWQEVAEHAFHTLRCAACHQREDADDFWFTLEAADPKRQAEANPYDEFEPAEATIHRLRPPLTFAGEKLRPEWTAAFLAGRIPEKPRPGLPARMPAFPAFAQALARGFAEQHGFGPLSPPLESPNPQLAAAGSALIRKGALACVDCHAVGDQPALAGQDTVTINFAHIPARLTPHYYERYLQDPPRVLPGTMMPRFSDDHGRTGLKSYFDGDARQQFHAIRHFMLTLPSSAGAP